MFKTNFIRFCNLKGESPSFVCRQIGVAPATFSGWTDSTVPRESTLIKIADYLGVTVDELLAEDTPAPLPFAVVAPMSISVQERALLLAFRSASAERRESVLLLLGLPAERKESEA